MTVGLPVPATGAVVAAGTVVGVTAGAVVAVVFTSTYTSTCKKKLIGKHSETDEDGGTEKEDEND